ncbi:hypothetical protein BKK79_00155 [Cupriavidus sp. USMAA2-4]|nr:hypothetical protein BKK79_00155 [Cupriavidus sp. USMAA2-4]
MQGHIMMGTTQTGGQDLEKYFASYVGMEGGNPRSKIWFCDVAPHPAMPGLQRPLEPAFAPPSWNDSFRKSHGAQMGKWLGHQRIAKVMTACVSALQGRHAGPREWEDYFRASLYRPEGNEFKINLYPLPLRPRMDISWRDAYGHDPLLVHKAQFIDVCHFGGRFAFLKAITRNWAPRVVVCINKTYSSQYIDAFGLAPLRPAVEVLQPADLTVKLIVYQDAQTRWVLCPPLAGPVGMSSDSQLSSFGELLANWCREPASATVM